MNIYLFTDQFWIKQNNMYTFSIITPSFNQGQFLEDTIKSVLTQSGDFYIDYIIADGGSTDNSVGIIRKYDNLLKGGQFPIKCKGITYRWWSKKDNGQSAAINEGFSVANGDIYAWINSDDFYNPGTVNLVSELFRKQELQFIHGDAYMLDLNRGSYEKPRTFYKKSFDGNYNDLMDDDFIYQSSVFFKKDLFLNSERIDENLVVALDYDLWIKMFGKLSKEQILYINKPLSSYRMWQASKTFSYLKISRKERILLDKRYHMKFISPAILYNPCTAPFFYFLRNYVPLLLKIIKKPIIFLNNRKRYPKIKTIPPPPSFRSTP